MVTAVSASCNYWNSTPMQIPLPGWPPRWLPLLLVAGTGVRRSWPLSGPTPRGLCPRGWVLAALAATPVWHAPTELPQSPSPHQLWEGVCSHHRSPALSLHCAVLTLIYQHKHRCSVSRKAEFVPGSRTGRRRNLQLYTVGPQPPWGPGAPIPPPSKVPYNLGLPSILTTARRKP